MCMYAHCSVNSSRTYMLKVCLRSVPGVTNGNRRYIYIYIYIYIWYVRPHFSSTVLGLRNVGGVECQPFLKHSNHWKRH